MRDAAAANISVTLHIFEIHILLFEEYFLTISSTVDMPKSYISLIVRLGLVALYSHPADIVKRHEQYSIQFVIK